MSDRFHDRYRIPSARASWWDYGRNAAYFVTIIIIDKRIGMIVENESIESTDNNPFNSMTNPTNAIIENLTDAPDGISAAPVETRLITSLQPNQTVQYDSSVNHDPSIRKQRSININKTRPQKLPGGITGENNPMLHDNLSRDVRWYKGRTTFESHKINPNLAWQARFYETIIRSEQSYRIKSEYIISNSSKWKDDQFYIS